LKSLFSAYLALENRFMGQSLTGRRLEMRAAKVAFLSVAVVGLSFGISRGAVKSADWTDAGTDNPPVTVSVDASQTPGAYSASGITVDMDEATPQAPHFGDTFSFSFNTSKTGAFAVVEDKTYAAANPANPNKEDIQSTTLTNVETETLESGDIEITFDTTYAAANLPADYQAFFGQTTAVGYGIVDYNPNADSKMVNDDVDYAYVTIYVPEPGTMSLLGMAGLGLLSRRRVRQASGRTTRI
jgi:PEP-CTERM motif-containing protein